MNKIDKEIWDRAYKEEYFGLHDDTNTWEYITETEYQQLKPTVGHALPTMAIATIKPDKYGRPQCAKYRIVVLGNMDPNNWSKNDCFAPVMSQLEFCLLIATAVQMRRKIKVGDFKQAFCQSFLPPGEEYVVRPPKD
eukprot:6833251-Ditylum_brightwellii.AAC.1